MFRIICTHHEFLTYQYVYPEYNVVRAALFNHVNTSNSLRNQLWHFHTSIKIVFSRRIKAVLQAPAKGKKLFISFQVAASKYC